jgi:hypothetical protein
MTNLIDEANSIASGITKQYVKQYGQRFEDERKEFKANIRAMKNAVET